MVSFVKRKKDPERFYQTTHTTIVVAIDTEEGKVLIAEAMPTKKKNVYSVTEQHQKHFINGFIKFLIFLQLLLATPGKVKNNH